MSSSDEREQQAFENAIAHLGELFRRIVALDRNERAELFPALTATLAMRRQELPANLLNELADHELDYALIFAAETIGPLGPPAEALVYDEPFRYAAAQSGPDLADMILACAVAEAAEGWREKLREAAGRQPTGERWEGLRTTLSELHREVYVALSRLNIEHAIEERGWFAFYVMDTPPVLYTTGFERKDWANVVVTGLDQNLSHAIADAAWRGREAGGEEATVLEEFAVPIWLAPVTKEELDAVLDVRHTSATSRFVVAVWPDEEGLFPWDEGCESEVAAAQPLAPATRPTA